VIAVFEAWRKLIPYYNGREASGVLCPIRSWQEAATALESGQAGMFYFSLSLAGEFQWYRPTVVDDIDFFEFPYFGNQWDAEKVVEAPTGIWVMPSKSPTLQADRANAKAYLDFWARARPSSSCTPRGQASSQRLSIPTPPNSIGLSKKAFELVGGAQHSPNSSMPTRTQTSPAPAAWRGT